MFCFIPTGRSNLSTTYSKHQKIYCYDYLSNERPVRATSVAAHNRHKRHKRHKRSDEPKKFVSKNKLLRKEFEQIMERKSKHLSSLENEMNNFFHNTDLIVYDLNAENIVDFVYVSFIIMYPFILKSDAEEQDEV